ncbi:3-hydroxybutyryl-CoA dehydrogenase [Bacillus sp. FSL W8-0445]|jgi:3-hydroxybutyryl-CoA dehydrogenase|uniref:3-hydroxybutyryl-CoA dehydrogenase n=3 Tax=Bacillus subtilis group TaxID=653685 RepID=Q65DT3_BACLD|nr:MULTISPECIES: 3-hydroxybutyryl-CoA dehydrogenase [Bacillus]MDP4080031.1 3-hydroxybutyryl-CoA dehydrogenase [Bacillota bacterium]AAU25406.1 3-hydroxybutyryl-CoA dehydrogenase [Bacillus licheniformis DSM 13 = ATCC 14580]AAU42781.1 3-hydroxybutyryl-CoA dehydrogenase MmgB [Bacillus licheniformis DSM 13 = ATCC 14580]AMR12301.1 3-hydroxybutyryl-CoA dehydrogenase [Bacillus licheniformis]APJ28807.1 3-hydroxybutyryl-CoA dehydrogenase [Bacillus sp. H15-1]
MKKDTIMVIGAGQMGSGIAQVSAQAGYNVYMYDVSPEQIEKGMKRISGQLFRQAEKGKLPHEDVKQIYQRLSPSAALDEAREAFLIIEAAVEQMDVKKDIFTRLDEVTEDSAILASNTSSLSITELAAVTKKPQNVIGMHFMNPVPVMQLVEVIRGLETSGETYETVVAAAERMNKVPIEVRDFPGFISNRILMPMINEAVFALYEGIAEKESIDGIMKLGMNHPMGPLALADLIGLDTCLYIMETLHEGFGDDKYRPCPLLKQYVSAGRLGKKTGRGFYTYEKQPT